MNKAGCAVSTRYPTVPLPILQYTDAAHAFINPLTSVMYVCVGTPTSGEIGHSGNVDNIVSVDIVILSCFFLDDRSVEMLIYSNDC